jgi:hypothetical protein
VKRERKFGTLLERAMRGEQLNLREDIGYVFSALDCIRESLLENYPLDDGQRELLLAVIDDCLLPGQTGRYPGWCRDERQWELLLAKALLEVGKEEYRAALGLERVRDDENLRRHAVKLLKQHRPQATIDHRDLHSFRTVPSAAVVACVAEQMPGAEEKMQMYARSLAGRRARGQ